MLFRSLLCSLVLFLSHSHLFPSLSDLSVILCFRPFSFNLYISSPLIPLFISTTLYPRCLPERSTSTFPLSSTPSLAPLSRQNNPLFFQFLICPSPSFNYLSPPHGQSHITRFPIPVPFTFSPSLSLLPPSLSNITTSLYAPVFRISTFLYLLVLSVAFSTLFFTTQ